MSLDVRLTEDYEERHSANITHNLIPMAQALGIYEALWGCDRDTVAAALIEPLTRAVTTLATHQAQFEAFDAPNGWGKRESLLLFLARQRWR